MKCKLYIQDRPEKEDEANQLIEPEKARKFEMGEIVVVHLLDEYSKHLIHIIQSGETAKNDHHPTSTIFETCAVP